MKKIFSILVITVWLMQAVTVNVHAAMLFQTDYSAVDLLENEVDDQLVYVNIVTADHSADVIMRGVSGEGTSVANTVADITTQCPVEVDENTTSDCPSASVTVIVNNQDPINDRDLYTCTYITQADDTWVTVGRYRSHNGFSQFGPYLPLPYAKCQRFLVAANAGQGVTVDVDGGTGEEGELRNWTVHMAFSWSPINTCGEAFVVESSDTFAVNVQIEDPVLQSAPDQVFDVTAGNYYNVYTSGTYYSPDYSAEYFFDELQYSWDNETWFNTEFYDSECFQSEEDRTGWYLLAESDKLYVRTGDGFTGEVASGLGGYNADDHVADGTTFYYTVEEGFPPQSCDQQFTYSLGDVVANVTVPADAESGVLGSDALSPGEWYSVVVTSGTWQDDGTGPARVDMQYKVYGEAGYNEDAAFHAFGSGTGSWCSSITTGIFYFQAQNTTIKLRVNNTSGDFASNTGSLNVSIYSASFERAPESCEQDYELDGLQDHQTVQADASNGKLWGTWSGSSSSSSSVGTASGGNLVPGAWYVVDTTDGPWTQHGGGLLGTAHPVSAFYDMAVSEDGEAWNSLQYWDLPVCNVRIDALGHRRIYFQAPADAGFSWYFRVDDDDDNWTSNAGELGWNLYRATKSSTAGSHGTLDDPWASCGDEYSHRLLYNAGTSIPVQEEEGTYIRQSLLGIASSSTDELPADASGSMSVGDVFKVVIFNGPWLDGTDEHFDAAISSDDGATWYAFEDAENPNIDCVSVDQAGKYYTVMFTVVSGQRWKVRVNDEAGDFVGNTGNLSYKAYKLTNNDAEVLGDAGSSDSSGSSSDASGLGTAGGGLAVCIQPLMYPAYVAPTDGVFTQPDRPEGLDVWEWLQWIGDSLYQTSTFFFGYLPHFLGAAINYAVGWINYAVLSAQKFFAFCPKDEGNLITAINVLKNKEPLATIFEIRTFVTDVQEKLNSYDWGDYADTSIFSLHSSSDVRGLVNSILRKDASAQNPWTGTHNVVSFGDTGLPASYYSCGTAFTDFLPERLRSAVCFVTAYFKETGAAFWIQLLVVDIGAISIYAMSTKRALQELIYMMTGVKPWTKSGVNSSVDKLAAYMERRDRDAELSDEALLRREINSGFRNMRFRR